MKICKKCDSMFDKKQCTNCKKVRDARYRSENADKIKKYWIEYKRDPEKAKEARLKYFNNNPLKIKESQDKYKTQNEEEIKIRKNRYRLENPDKVKQAQVRHNNNNPYAYALRHASNRCKRYNKKFPDRTPRFVSEDLTPDFLESIYTTEICPLYGVKMSHIVGDPNKASLDRIDSAGSYTRENVWWVCKDANTDKRDMSLKQFKKMVQRIKNLPEIVDE
jgi:hypothetical protein